MDVFNLYKSIDNFQTIWRNEMKKYEVSQYLTQRNITKIQQMNVLKELEHLELQEQRGNIKGLGILQQVSKGLQDEVFYEYYGRILKNSQFQKISQYSFDFIKSLAIKMQEINLGQEVILLEQGQIDGRYLFLIEGSRFNALRDRWLYREELMNIRTDIIQNYINEIILFQIEDNDKSFLLKIPQITFKNDGGLEIDDIQAIEHSESDEIQPYISDTYVNEGHNINQEFKASYILGKDEKQYFSQNQQIDYVSNQNDSQKKQSNSYKNLLSQQQKYSQVIQENCENSKINSLEIKQNSQNDFQSPFHQQINKNEVNSNKYLVQNYKGDIFNNIDNGKTKESNFSIEYIDSKRIILVEKEFDKFQNFEQFLPYNNINTVLDKFRENQIYNILKQQKDGIQMYENLKKNCRGLNSKKRLNLVLKQCQSNCMYNNSANQYKKKTAKSFAIQNSSVNQKDKDKRSDLFTICFKEENFIKSQKIKKNKSYSNPYNYNSCEKTLNASFLQNQHIKYDENENKIVKSDIQKGQKLNKSIKSQNEPKQFKNQYKSLQQMQSKSQSKEKLEGNLSYCQQINNQDNDQDNSRAFILK
ncbi:Cyclic nucleotide-binding protein [Pseudocohnilembus persalinus]|uniref:Cyclic nucleotide-binding protein n=1 Tax=Pseudocohnilembus persalinus TaxID=266149 RepID=A0A0V0R5I6_PSEPJ|nr:Cyclic nucleotide-binding protein [Pseudocohnilembus persalinus]|eukprot:KRX09737.1 Cyclic nucleotide-binding protein [Pseudocohnilembus persalinus]